MGESSTPSSWARIQAIMESLDGLKPQTVADRRRIEIMRSHMKEVRRDFRRLEEKVRVLEENKKD